jgi:anti-sigma B factor antagonist
MSEIVFLKPSGRLDAFGARGLWEELEPLTHMPHLRVLVDMSQARYLSSEGLRVLVRASKGIKQGGGKFVVCCLSARLIEIVTMAGIDRVLEIYPTERAARQALETHAAL